MALAMDIHSFNLLQKIIASAFISLVVISIFLHNPTSGYITEKTNPLYESGVHRVPCTQREKDAFRADWEQIRENGILITNDEADTQAYIDSSVEACTQSVSYIITAPFSEWRSNEPIIFWFSFLSNLVQLLIVLGVISGVVFVLFKDQENTN